MSDQKEIQNLVTDVPFKLVSAQNPDELNEFLVWAQDVQTRSQTKHVHIAIDCEGDCLGTKSHSLSLVQIGEIFDDSFDILKPGLTLADTPPIGARPGFALIFPAAPEVKEALSLILNEPSVFKYTFDCTCDFCSLFEEGIQINPENLFDAQLNFPISKKYVGKYFYITATNGQGLKTAVKNAAKLSVDPLASKATQNYFQSKKCDFALFDYQNRENPMRHTLQYTPEFFQMAVIDVFFTGLAVKLRILEGKIPTVFEYSREKWNEIQEVNQMYHHPLAASFMRQDSFFQAMGDGKFYGKEIINTADNLANTLNKWSKLSMEIRLHQIMPSFKTEGPFKLFKVETIFKRCDAILKTADFSILG